MGVGMSSFWSCPPPEQPQNEACSQPRGFVLLPSSVPAVWMSLQGTGQWLCHPVWDMGSAPSHRRCCCECSDVPPLSVSLCGHSGQFCQDWQPVSFSNVLASARTSRTAWESRCPQSWPNPFMEAPCARGGQKGAVCGWILLAQELH